MRFLLLITFILFSFVCFSQQTDTTGVPEEYDEGVLVKPDNSGPLKLGLKLGAGYSSMLGKELENPAGTFGIDGSAYLRYRFKPMFAFQTEVGASFRGGNFNNGPGEYSSIKTYYIDLPAMIVIAVDKTTNNHIIAGVQYSRLVNSSLYLTNSVSPETNAPSLKKDDVMALIGMQFYTPFVGFQILAKIGVLDINDGLMGANTKPKYKGKDIRNLAIELNFLF